MLLPRHKVTKLLIWYLDLPHNNAYFQASKLHIDFDKKQNIFLLVCHEIHYRFLYCTIRNVSALHSNVFSHCFLLVIDVVITPVFLEFFIFSERDFLSFSEYSLISLKSEQPYTFQQGSQSHLSQLLNYFSL